MVIAMPEMIADREWVMLNGECAIAEGLPIADCRLRTVNRELRTANYEL
jgi:hypothetical protein